MALLGNNHDALFNALSDFWLRFFRDIEDIKAVLEGTQLLYGQVYLNLLSDVLNTSVSDVPLFRKEQYYPLTVRQADFKYDRDRGFWRHPIGKNFVGAAYLQNKIWGATQIYEAPKQFAIENGDLILPDHNPGSPPQLPTGFSQRTVRIGVDGTFTATGVTDWMALGVRPGDVLFWSPGPIADPRDALRATIKAAEGDTLFLTESTTPISAATGNYWAVVQYVNSNVVYEIVFGSDGYALSGPTVYDTLEVAAWLVDGLVDEKTLYRNFGYLFDSDEAASTEAYRGFLRGVMQLYVLGPTLRRMESALNVVADLPVVRNDGEVLAGYDSGITATGTDGSLTNPSTFSSPTASFTTNDVGGYLTLASDINAANVGMFVISSVVNGTTVVLTNNYPFVTETGTVTWKYGRNDFCTVVTDQSTYYLPRGIQMRADVVDPSSIGQLTFQVFEPLAAALKVTDYTEDPEWWVDSVIPLEVMPGETLIRRNISRNVYENIIGSVSDPKVGDPGLFIGANEYGYTSNDPTFRAFRHNTAFILMDQFLKAHIFSFKVDPVLAFNGKRFLRAKRLLLDVKPAQTMLYFHPFTKFTDRVSVSDTLQVSVNVL